MIFGDMWVTLGVMMFGGAMLRDIIMKRKS